MPLNQRDGLDHRWLQLFMASCAAFTATKPFLCHIATLTTLNFWGFKLLGFVCSCWTGLKHSTVCICSCHIISITNVQWTLGHVAQKKVAGAFEMGQLCHNRPPNAASDGQQRLQNPNYCSKVVFSICANCVSLFWKCPRTAVAVFSRKFCRRLMSKLMFTCYQPKLKYRAWRTSSWC